jgi:acyl-coenzyme A thioesterase PaaI-like protein
MTEAIADPPERAERDDEVLDELGLSDADSRGFIAALGLELWTEGGITHGRAELGPSVWARETERPRLGALATMVDVVAGTLPTGPINPTVDLNVQLLTPLPPTGGLHLVCHPAKVGRRLFVGEVIVDDGDAVVARGTATFINRPMGVDFSSVSRLTTPVVSSIAFDDWLMPRFPDERTVVVDKASALVNGPGGTVQGGVQATLAEIASEWVLVPSGRCDVTDLDIRYLNPVRVGPVVAVAHVLGVTDGRAFVRVTLSDAGDDGAVVALASTVCRMPI